MRLLNVLIFFQLISYIHLKLCPFFKNDGLVCQKGKIKGLIFDKNHDRLISFGLDSVAIMWDLTKMNDLNQITQIHLDYGRNEIIILNQNGYLSILQYPSGQITEVIQVSETRIIDFSFFHSSLPFVFVFTSENTITIINYFNQDDKHDYILNDKILKYQIQDRGDYSYVIFYLQNGNIINLSNKQMQQVQLDNSLFALSTQSYFSSLNMIIAISKDQLNIIATSFDQNSVIWKVEPKQTLFLFFLKIDDTSLIAIFLQNNTIQLYSQGKGTFIGEIQIPSSNFSNIVQAYYIQQTKQIIFNDGSGTIFICSFNSESQLVYQKKQVSFSSITKMFLAETYVILETEREEEGFYVFNSFTESIDSIKCFLPQTNFEVSSYPDSIAKKFNTVVDYDNSIIIRFFLNEIDAWNYNSNIQLFYDDLSLSKFLYSDNKIYNEIINVAFDTLRGVLVSIQLDQSIAIWDYWTGSLLKIYNETELPSQIFYSKNNQTFIIKESTKLILLQYTKNPTLGEDILTRIEIPKQYILKYPEDGFMKLITKVDNITGNRVDCFRFYQIDSQINQNSPDLAKGYFQTEIDLINNIIFIYYRTYIQYIQIDVTLDKDKMNVNFKSPQNIQLKISSTYSIYLNYQQKQVLIATDTKLFTYNYQTNSLIKEIQYSQLSRENIQISFLQNDNTIILYNQYFFLTLDGQNYQQMNNYLSDQRFSIQQLYVKQNHLLIGLQDNRILIFDTSNLKSLVLELNANKLVFKFIQYLEVDSVILVQFIDGTVGKISADSPFFHSEDIKLMNTQKWNMKHFIKDNLNNNISFNTDINGQFYVAKVQLEDLTILKQKIDPLSWNSDEISEIKYVRIVKLPQNLKSNEQNDNSDTDNQQQIEYYLVFQQRRNLKSNVITFDVFLYNPQKQIVEKYNQNIHTQEIFKIEHGLVTIKNSQKQAYVCLTINQLEKSIKVWSIPSLEQLNKPLQFILDIKAYVVDFQSSNLIYTLDGSNSVQVYNFILGKITKIILSLLSQCTSINVDYQQNLLILGESVGRISVYQYSSFIPLSILPSIDSGINLLNIDESSQYLMVGSENNKLFIYKRKSLSEEFQQFNLMHVIQFTEAINCAYIESQLNILFTCQPGIVKAWNLNSGNLLGQALVDSTKQIIKKFYFSIYSRILIICTKQSVFVYDSLYVTNFGYMMNLIQMKASIKEAIYLEQKNLLIYSQLMNEKSIGSVEYWDAENEKMKLIHSCLVCKPIQIINMEYFLVIQCKYQLMIINSNDLYIKSSYQFNQFPIRSEMIIQSKYFQNHLYGVSKIDNSITLFIVCFNTGQVKPSLIEQSTLLLADVSDSLSDFFDKLFFFSKELILISFQSGSFIIINTNLIQKSQLISSYYQFNLQGVIEISKTLNTKKIIIHDKRGILNIFEISYIQDKNSINEGNQEQDDSISDEEQCFSSKLIDNYQHFLPYPNKCNELKFKIVNDIKIKLLISYNQQSKQLSNIYDVIILQKANAAAFVSQGLEILQFISLFDLQPIQQIFIPVHNYKMEILSCLKSNIVILLTSFQINVYKISFTDTPTKKWNIDQKYLLIDYQLSLSQKILFLQKNIFLVTCEKGYQVIELQALVDQKSRILQDYSVISKHITYLDFPIIIHKQLMIDNQGHTNIILRGYHEKGLFIHIVPLVQEDICQHDIMETEFLLVEKTLKYLETTYDTTEIKFNSFYITIHLNQMKKLMGIPDLSFKYNSTLHMKGLSNQKKVISFTQQQNQQKINLDISSWESFILENAILLPVYENENDNHKQLQIINTNNGCKNLTLIGIDFYSSVDQNQKGTNPPSSDRYLSFPLQLNINNISNVTIMDVELNYQLNKNNKIITIVNALNLNIINFKVDSVYLEYGQIIKSYSNNLQSNRTKVKITNFQVTRSIIKKSSLIQIDNCQDLEINDVRIKYNQASISVVFYLSGITNHKHLDTVFSSNTGLSYIHQVSSIQNKQQNSYDYQIQNSTLFLQNIIMETNKVETSMMQLGSFNINIFKMSYRKISLIKINKISFSFIKNKRNRIQFQSLIENINQTTTSTNAKSFNDYFWFNGYIKYEPQNTTIHFENKKDKNSFLYNDFHHPLNEQYISIPSIFLEYEDENTKYLWSQRNFTKALIIIKQISTVYIEDVIFDTVDSFDHIIQGKQIIVRIEKSVFRKITGEQLKGILFFSSSVFSIQNSIFRENRSLFCTCIYVQDSEIRQEQNIIRNNSFHNNTAQLTGGAFCGINTIFEFQNNVFHLNSALVGGAIYYYHFSYSKYIQSNLAKVVLQSNYFSENSCKIFGQNIGSHPRYLQTLNNHQHQSTHQVQNFRSGDLIDLNIALYDEEDKIIQIKETPLAVFIITMKDFLGLRLNDYSPIQLQYNKTLNASIFQFNKKQIIGLPDSSASLKFDTPSMPADFVENGINFLDQEKDQFFQANYQQKLHVDIYFRECVQGEVYSQDTIQEYFTCKECIEGYYSLIDPQSFESNNQKCMLCPSSKASFCSTNQIYIKPGFWRFHNQTDEIFECINNQKNCAGNDTCIEGHIGPLCEDCDIEGKVWNQKQNMFNNLQNLTFQQLKNRYYRVGVQSYDCTKCQNETKQYLYVVFLIFFMSLYLSWSVKKGIDRAKATIQVEVMRKIKMISLGRSSFISLTAAYIKISADYFQIVSGLKYFAINYPSVDILVDTVGDSFSQTSYSLDCFLEKSISQVIPLNYSRIIWIHINALIYLIVFTLIYKLLVCLRIVDKKTYIWTNALILFSIFTQNSIMSVLISSMSCRNIGDKKYVKFFIQMECWEENHISLFTNLLLPLLIIQILSIIIKFYILFSIRKNLNNFFNILKYGLLYLEYTPQNYYWEFVKIIKRFLVTFFINVFDQNNQIKGIMCSLVLIIYYSILHKMQPFRKASLNNLEKRSTIVQLILYFFAVLESIKDKNQQIFAGLIISINIIFLSSLLYKVIKKNRLFQRITQVLQQLIQKKCPKIHKISKLFFSSSQSQVRILWRNLAWHVSEFLERRKKDKNAQMFATHNDLESTSRYKLKDMRSSQQIKQYYQQISLPDQQSTKSNNVHNTILVPKQTHSSTNLEMIQIDQNQKNPKKKYLLMSDSILLDDKKLPKERQKSINLSQSGIYQSGFKNGLIFRNRELLNSVQSQTESISHQIKNIIENKTIFSEQIQTIQSTQSNSEKGQGEQTISLNQKMLSSEMIPTEYDEESDSIFQKYNRQYSNANQNMYKQEQIKNIQL